VLRSSEGPLRPRPRPLDRPFFGGLRISARLFGPYARLLSAQVAIGAAAIFARYALLGAGPLAVSALRLLIATVPVAIVVLLTHRRVHIGWRRELSLAVGGGLLAAHFATWIASLLYTSVAISTLLVCTSPLWTSAYDVLVERKPPSRAFLGALVLAAIGLVAIALQRAAPAPVAGHALLGDLLALAGALALAVYFIIVRAAGITPAHGDPLSTPAIVVRTYAWAAAALCIVALAGHESPPSFSNLPSWGGIVAMALISQSLGHTGMNAALRNFTPSVVALSTLLEPPIAAFLAAFLFNEALSLQTIAGGLAILAAVAITLLSARRSDEFALISG